jgi:hypothetical protein
MAGNSVCALWGLMSMLLPVPSVASSAAAPAVLAASAAAMIAMSTSLAAAAPAAVYAPVFNFSGPFMGMGGAFGPVYTLPPAAAPATPRRSRRHARERPAPNRR